MGFGPWNNLLMENLVCVGGTKTPFCLLSFRKTKAFLESIGERHEYSYEC